MEIENVISQHLQILLWIIEALTLERFTNFQLDFKKFYLLRVQTISYFPKEYRNAGLVQNKNLRVAKYLIPVIIFSVFLNIPKFVETSVEFNEETNEVHSCCKMFSILNAVHFKVTYNVSAHRRDPTFIWYYTVLYSFHPLITTELGPIFILITLNILIFKKIMKTKKRFEQTTIKECYLLGYI